jgi:alpha-tubulin suppressor-like RCC1 family protein
MAIDIKFPMIIGGSSGSSFTFGKLSSNISSTTTPAPAMGGQLWAWGNNAYGALGNSDTPNPQSSPVQTIAGGSDWQTSSARGLYGSAIKTDGTLWTWGRNSYGQLGDNTTVNKDSPIQTVTFSTDWVSVNCGSNSMTAIKKDGTLWTWGFNYRGQLGDGTTIHRSSPVQTAAFGNNWQQVSGGYAHKAAIKTDGTLWTWGYNYEGQLGYGTNSSANNISPLQTVSYGTDWSSVACGNSFTVAIKKDGTLWAWGKNSYGQLGINTTTNRNSPVQEITGGTNWSTVACGYAMTVATKTDGTLWTWGSNLGGELGDNTISLPKSSPVQTVAGGTNWASAHAGALVAGGIKKDGSLWMWGNNPVGQLGDNTSDNKSSPVQTIMGGAGWSSLSIGDAVNAIKA